MDNASAAEDSTKHDDDLNSESGPFGKKFQCNLCDFKCLTHGGLSLHHKAVHLGIRFKCNQCSYQGTQEVNLKRHIQSKHGTVQYSCNLCNCKSGGLWYIETHMKKVHGLYSRGVIEENLNITKSIS